MENIKEKKKALRKEIAQRVKALEPDYIAMSDKRIVEHIMAQDIYRNAKTIFVYVGMDRELNTKPLIQQAFAEGKRVGVPYCRTASIMDVYEITSLDNMVLNKFGTEEPDPNTATLIEKEEIDFALIPCASCNTKGDRIGFGRGYYDRFLEHASFDKILALREQLLTEDIPLGQYDVPIPYVVTEKGVYIDGKLQ